MGAYGLAVAAAFAVALAVLMSVSPTSTVEAADIAVGTDNTATVEPGDTAVMTVPGRIVRFTIDGDNSTSTGSFASGGGQTIACSDDAACDTGTEDGDGDAATPETDVANSIQVKLDIDEDAADGFIIVKTATVIAADGTVGSATSTIVITVKTQPVAASLTAKATSTTIQADPVASPVGDGTDPDRTTITATVKNDAKEPVGKAHETLTFITTLGTLTCDASAAVNETGPPPITLGTIGAASGVQVCQIRTVLDDVGTADVNELGTATVTLVGAGREGTATVTITHGNLDPASVDVTFYGDADAISAEVEQGSIEVSGSVFVVLTVTDAAGNPVKNQEPEAAEKDALVSPTEGGNTVETDYEVNKLDKDGKVAIPACAAHAAVTQADVDNDPTAGPVTLGSSGTNDDGQCVVQVTATPDDTSTTGTNEASTRGTHTLNFALGKFAASASLEVAGGPASIESDAPEYVEPLSDTTITVTVRDDEGVLVGETDINVIKVAGDGLAEGKAAADGAQTSNGSSTFSYAAGLEGQVVFRVIAGSGDGAVRDIITLTVGFPDMDCPDGTSVAYGESCPDVECPDGTSVGNGETCPDVECPDGTSVANGESCPDVECSDGTSVGNGETCPDIECPDGTSVADGETCPEPEPVAPEAGTLTVQGNLGSYSGGSLDDFAAAADASCPGGSQIAAQDADGAWQLWSSTAPAFVNIGFNTAFADGFDGATLVWVTSCEADAMDSETGMEEGSMAEGSMAEGSTEGNGS